MIPIVTARMLALQWFPAVRASLAHWPDVDGPREPFAPMTRHEAHCVALAARLVSTLDPALPLDLDSFAGLDRLDREELDETDAPSCRVVRPWTLRALVMGRAA